uniref:Uncharacterized protein n=1 Tax=Panagrolaimus sp. JU765 TaxID=591449 RepID=A0AC34RAT5_9BILA
MRNLALRFVKPLANSSAIETVVHVVDPNVDLRKLFQNQNLLKNQLEKRKINKNLEEISKNYKKWWNLYEKLENFGEESENLKEIKLKMMEEEQGLIEALKLPNLIETKHFLDYQTNVVKINEFERQKSLMRTTDLLEKSIYEAFSIIRIDPPRMVRPAIIEAFNYSKDEIIRFHEGKNPAMNLV